MKYFITIENKTQESLLSHPHHDIFNPKTYEFTKTADNKEELTDMIMAINSHPTQNIVRIVYGHEISFKTEIKIWEKEYEPETPSEKYLKRGVPSVLAGDNVEEKHEGLY